jgi:hypothetical protein
MPTKKNTISLAIFAASSAFVLSACQPSTQTGVLVDSAVSGIRYETETQSGYTGAGGSFQYRAGETIEFSIGDITFPRVPVSRTLTPLELGSTDLVNEQTAINIARFLQSVDEDQDPSNGISINTESHSKALGVSLNFDVPPSSFESDAALLNYLASIDGRVIIDQAAALTHLEETLSGLANGRQITVNLDDGIEQEITQLIQGAGYTSEELAGKCFDLGAHYDNADNSSTICFNGDGTGTITILGLIPINVDWSVNREGGLSLSGDYPSLQRNEDGSLYRDEDGNTVITTQTWSYTITRLSDGSASVQISIGDHSFTLNRSVLGELSYSHDA